MVRSLVVSCLAFAGVWLLAGLGWALLAGAGLVLVFWPAGVDMPASVAVRRVVAWLSGAGRWARSAPRRAVAGAGMASGVVLAPAGITMAVSVGAGLVAAAVGLVGVALLLGWGA